MELILPCRCQMVDWRELGSEPPYVGCYPSNEGGCVLLAGRLALRDSDVS
jgi:hypothetical protein